jgi:hypothetical protein
MTDRSVLFVLSAAICLSVLSCQGAFAKNNPDRSQFGRDIHVDIGEHAGDLTCVNCSIYIRGQAAGDATTLHGNVVVEGGGEVAGDVTAVWGDIRAGTGAHILGDATAVAGAVRRDPQAAVGGDVTALEGTKWLIAIIVPPLLFLGAIVSLIVWLIQRGQSKGPVPYESPRTQSGTHL